MAVIKLTITVTAGIQANKPIASATREWIWTEAQAQAMKSKDERVSDPAKVEWLRVSGESREYAASLEDPARFSWVRRDWVYS